MQVTCLKSWLTSLYELHFSTHKSSPGVDLAHAAIETSADAAGVSWVAVCFWVPGDMFSKQFVNLWCQIQGHRKYDFLRQTVSICLLPWTQLHNLSQLQNCTVGKHFNGSCCFLCRLATCICASYNNTKAIKMHLQRHGSHYTHAESSVTAYPSILTFCSGCTRHDTPVITLLCISCQAAFGCCALATSWKPLKLDIDSQTQHSFRDFPIQLPAAPRNVSKTKISV